MTSDQKTRTLIGILAAAVVILIAYAIVGERKSAPASTVRALPAAPAEASAASEPIAGSPDLRIESVGTVLTQSGGHEARASSDSELGYTWTIYGGTFEGGNEGPLVVWRAGTGREVILQCQGTNAEGKSNTATFRASLRPPVEILNFEASPAVVTEGNAVKLLWSVKHGEKLVLDPEARDLGGSPESSLEVKPGRTGAYTLRAQGAAGSTATKAVQVKVVPAPELLVWKAEPVAGALNAFTITAEFRGGKAELRRGGQVLAATEVSPLRLEVGDMATGASLIITVTNEAGTYVSNTLTVSSRR